MSFEVVKDNVDTRFFLIKKLKRVDYTNSFGQLRLILIIINRQLRYNSLYPLNLNIF